MKIFLKKTSLEIISHNALHLFNMAAVGSLTAEASRRKERLKALRQRQQGDSEVFTDITDNRTILTLT